MFFALVDDSEDSPSENSEGSDYEGSDNQADAEPEERYWEVGTLFLYEKLKKTWLVSFPNESAKWPLDAHPTLYGDTYVFVEEPPNYGAVPAAGEVPTAAAAAPVPAAPAPAAVPAPGPGAAPAPGPAAALADSNRLRAAIAARMRGPPQPRAVEPAARRARVRALL